MMLLNAGAILALLGLLPVLSETGMHVAAAASGMRIPMASFLCGLLASVLSLLCLPMSTHAAAWGKSSSERRWRYGGIALVAIALALFAFGAWSALDTIRDPALFATE